MVALQSLVEVECQRWASKGINIRYENRDNRNGYKAGALKDGMEQDYAKGCDYVAIFDADFRPEPDFLWRTIPFLALNPDVALVQARWKYGQSPPPQPPSPLSLLSIQCGPIGDTRRGASSHACAAGPPRCPAVFRRWSIHPAVGDGAL